MSEATKTLSRVQQEALSRATDSASFTNYPAIFEGFMAKGIAEGDIKPRENVFTFNAWKALGRSVKRGEHGVKVVTFIECSGVERDPASGEDKPVSYRRPHTTTVFHVSQTEPTSQRQARRHRWRDDSWRSDPGEQAADRWNELHGDRQ
jgi:hypothetical protein